MTFWLDRPIVKSRENTNKSENDGNKHITNDMKRVLYTVDKVVVNDPIRPIDQNGNIFNPPVPPTPKPRKKYAKQSDRFLKQIPAGQRRKQMLMRKQIAEEIDNA